MLWDDSESEWIDEFEREVEAIFEEAYSNSINWLFELDQPALKPLYRVEVGKKELLLILDLPGVEKEQVKVRLTNEIIEVEAEMKHPVTILVGGAVQRHLAFQRYHGVVKLPKRVDPDRARARMRNGWLRIRVPLETD